jgi:hypothetical protein
MEGKSLVKKKKRKMGMHAKRRDTAGTTDGVLEKWYNNVRSELELRLT